MRVWGKRLIGLVLLLGSLTASVWAAEMKGVAVIGDDQTTIQRSIKLNKGNYELELLDVFQLGSDAADQQAVLLVDGDKLLGQLNFSSASGSQKKIFSIAETVTANLFLDAANTRLHGPVVVSIRASGAASPIYREVFNFQTQMQASADYSYVKTVPVTAQSLLFKLTDFGAEFGELLPTLVPFDNVVVEILNSSATAELQRWCWYRGSEAVTDCQNMDNDGAASSPLGLEQQLQIVDGFLSVIIEAQAPADQFAQIGWSLVDMAGVGVDLTDNVIVNQSPSQGRMVGEFTLEASTSVSALITRVSTDVTPFQLLIASADSTASIQVSQEDVSVGAVLEPGHYNIMLLSPEDGSGLVGLTVSADTGILFEDAFTLGGYQKLMAFTQAEPTQAHAQLTFLEGQQDIAVMAFGAGQAFNIASSATPRTEAISFEAGRYSLWSPLQTGIPDDLFYLNVGDMRGDIVQVYGSTGLRLAALQRFDSVAAGTYSVSVRNFEFPDEFVERYRVIVAQRDAAILKADFDSENAAKSIDDLRLEAGPAHVLVFASQSNERGHVVGFRLKSATTASPDAPDRGANGSGSGGGGGSFSSFVLYCLLLGRALIFRRQHGNGCTEKR